MRRPLVASLILAAVTLGSLAYANGVVIGRDDGGPLRIGHGTGAMGIVPGEIPQIDDVARVDGGAIDVESVRPALISPGLELLGPVKVAPDPEGPCIGCAGPWPPPRSRPPDRIANDEWVVTGMRARRPGVYYLHGLRYRYRRGIKRYDEKDDTHMCFVVGNPTRSECPMDDRVDGFEGVADIGGPSDFGDGRLVEDGWNGTVLRFDHRPGEELRFSLTLTNRSGEDRRVRRLDLGDPRKGFHDLLDPLPIEPFTIPAHGSRLVEVRARFAPCRDQEPGLENQWDELEAGSDDVELSLPVAVRVKRRCA